MHPGEFYALPQSPQIFKQILMIAGTDRYFQIVRCFRDEDQRADRQLEFTQIDVEMSFARPETIYGLIEPLMPSIFKEIGREVTLPIRRMPYAEAIATLRLGQAGPALRAWRSTICPRCSAIRSSASSSRSSPTAAWCAASPCRGGNKYSRSQLDVLVDQAKQMGFTGLIWVRPGRAAAQLGEGARARRRCARRSSACGAGGGRPAADGRRASRTRRRSCSGQLRLAIAKKENLLNPEAFEFLWVTDFPLLEYNEEDGRWYSMHHPFTSPLDEDIDKLESDPARCAPRPTTSC